MLLRPKKALLAAGLIVALISPAHAKSILWSSAHARMEIEKAPVAKYRVEIVEEGYRDGNRVYSPTIRIVLEDDTDIGLETEDPEKETGLR